MINEKTISIQAIYCGLETEEAWDDCLSIDGLLAKRLPYMYDKEFGFLSGYLTTTNRASNHGADASSGMVMTATWTT